MNKALFFALNFAALIQLVNAQRSTSYDITKAGYSNSKYVTIKANDLPSFQVALDKTTYIISPEPILYVDISSPMIEGNMPEKNIFRFKPDAANCKAGDQFQVTVVTEQFVMAYKMTLSSNDPEETTLITINPNEAVQTNSYNKVGKGDFDRLSMLALSKKREIHNIREKKYGMEMFINNIYVVGDFLLVDIGVKNKTNLQYDIDEIRFKLMDKKHVGAHISQEIELKPLYQFYRHDTPISGKWRNFYLFRKFTYPGEKVFNVELTEKQISGRRIDLNINYNELLHAQFLL